MSTFLKTNWKILALIGVFIILLGTAIVVGLYIKNQKDSTANISNFEQCAAAGYSIMESYPRQCRIPDGRTFIEEFLGAQLEGVVKFTDLEGGCWYLLADAENADAVKYELYGISKEQLEQYRDKKVKVQGEIRNDMASICQIGPILEVKEINLVSTDESDVSGWQTYRNEEYGFEVKYPVGWVVSPGFYPGTEIVVISSKRPTGAGYPAIENEAAITINPAPSILSEGREEELVGASGSGLIFVSDTALFREEDKIIMVSKHYWKDDAKTQQWEEIFAQILSTFRFVE